jgi:formylglycine-generating enzyme required for sulfatase activity
VSNREYLEFVRDEGYARRDLWTSDGWNWIEAEAMRHPRFWRQSGGAFRYRAMFDEFDLPLYWPVEVTCHEAEAFCAWKGGGARLPSEAEWVRMSGEVPAGDDDPAYSDNDNLNLKYGSPSPCGIADSTRSPRGLSDVFGNVWTWLRDDFYPLPGFTAHPWYEEFSAPYFDDQHAILRGGSWASLGTSASRFYRTWFRRSFHQHAGFRMARPLGPHSG